MNLEIPNAPKLSNTTKIIYISIIVICVISMIAALYIQLFIEKDKDTVYKELQAEEYENLQAGFEDIFQNTIKYANELSYSVKKIDTDKDIVYTKYENQKEEDSKYSLNVQLPYININNNTITKYNKEINSIFKDKAEDVISSENSSNVIYTVNYEAYISNDILSIIIHSTLKEGTTAQRDIIKTYNYNLKENKEISINDVLKIKGISESDANSKIKEKIQEKQKQIEDLAELGYSVYNRNPDSDIYKISNVEEFYFGEDEHLYIIFAYGNDNLTNEKDVVIF
jgi:hypothetical protein